MSDWDLMQMEQEREEKARRILEQESISIMKNPHIFKVITEDEFGKRIIGEYGTRKAIFLANCTIWVKGITANLLINGLSSVGKDFTVRNVLRIFPADRVITRTKITPEAFTYWHANEEEWTWDDKILYLPDISEGVLNSPTFKVMMSEGSHATVVKRQKVVEIAINGKPNIIVTTAESVPNAEILNRFSAVHLDETEEQTRKIMEFIAEDIDNQYESRITNALSKLKVVKIRVPFAKKLIDYFPNDVRMRRIFTYFINLIKASTALHQYQRQQNNSGEFVAEGQDYEIAKNVIDYIGENTISGLTHAQRRYFEKFMEMQESIGNEYYSVAEIHDRTSYMSLPMWYQYLKILEEKGFVLSCVVEQEGKKTVKKYMITPRYLECRIRLPSFEEL